MTTVFNDGVLEATLLPELWVVVRWLTNQRGRLSKTVVKDLHRLDREIVKQGWRGWLCGSEPENTEMHRLIEKFGAERCGEAPDAVFFRKCPRGGN